VTLTAAPDITLTQLPNGTGVQLARGGKDAVLVPAAAPSPARPSRPRCPPMARWASR
jgi:hypothetical protein